MIDTPDSLDSAAKAEYERIAKILLDRGEWLDDYRSVMSVHAQAWSDWLTARDRIAESGLMVLDDYGEAVQNPWSIIASKSEQIILNTARTMGLTLTTTKFVESPEIDDIDESDIDAVLRRMIDG